MYKIYGIDGEQEVSMSNRLEILLARQAAEKLKAAQPKPVKAKTPKAAKPRTVAQKYAKPQEPERVEFNPPFTMLEIVDSLTPAEAANPKIVAGVIAAAIIDQIMRTQRRLEMMSSTMSDNLAWITAAPFAERVDLKRVFSTAMMLTDALEFRSGQGEGDAVRALHQIEKALLEKKMEGEGR